jgi:predicted nucleotidyltransferase
MRECSEELLGEITRRLTEALRPSRVYLFGSQARGDADGDSDLDLLVVVPDTDTPPRELARLGRKSLWGMGVPVDIVVCTESELAKWSQVRCNIIHTAVEKGRLLLAS